MVNHWSLVVVVRPTICMEEDGLAENDPIDLATPTEHDKSCIMFLDSLGMHSVNTIGKKMRSYLCYEWVSSG